MSVKRPYAGFRAVRNAIIDHLKTDGTTTHTALEIALRCGLNKGSIRVAAKHLNVTLKPAQRGGRRYPANQHVKRALTESVAKAKLPDPHDNL